jgi:hypothetical protein
VPLRQQLEPVLRQRLLQVLERLLDTLEVLREGLVEAVEVLLVLDQRGAREEIEVVDAEAGDAALQRLEQREVFGDRGRYARLTQRVEKRRQREEKRGRSPISGHGEPELGEPERK